jgi:lactate permease
MFKQILDPTGNLFITWLIALVPVAALLVMLAVLRRSAWIATLLGSLLTLALALWVWQMPLEPHRLAWTMPHCTKYRTCPIS